MCKDPDVSFSSDGKISESLSPTFQYFKRVLTLNTKKQMKYSKFIRTEIKFSPIYTAQFQQLQLFPAQRRHVFRKQILKIRSGGAGERKRWQPHFTIAVAEHTGIQTLTFKNLHHHRYINFGFFYIQIHSFIHSFVYFYTTDLVSNTTLSRLHIKTITKKI